MNKHNKISLLLIAFILLSASSFFYVRQRFQLKFVEQATAGNNAETEATEERFHIDKTEILPGDTFSDVAARANLRPEQIQEIYTTALVEYDLAKIKAGSYLELVYDHDKNSLLEILYKIDSEKELVITSTGAINYSAQIRPIAYDTRVVTREAVIADSLYLAALDIGMDEKAVIELAEAFQWTIDFAMDPRVGDIFKVIYEERYLNGEYIRPGRILAARYLNNGTAYELYYFAESDDNEGYFDDGANSVQKMFLKAPVAFKYISSGFTTGSRYVEAFNVSTGHRAIDYAAPMGTPIRAVGDGIISSAAWSGAYGNMVSVRHNGTYTTNYAHMSKIAVSRGQRVKQGEVIGYVGSTGFSTGPHLHYEMVRNGVKVNPLVETLPPGTSIKEENKDRFFSSIINWQNQLREENN